MSAEAIAESLGLKRHGKNWRGPCPCCGGSARSGKFSLAEGRSGPVWQCFAGCSGDAIAAELRDRKLLEPRASPRRPPPKYSRDQIELAQLVVLIAEADARRWVFPGAEDLRALRKAVAIITHAPRQTAAGSLAQQALRAPSIRALVAKGLRHE